MRLHLALLKPSLREDPPYMSMTDNIRYKITKDIQHSKSASILSLGYDVADLPPLREDEIKQAMQIYNAFSMGKCEIFYDSIVPKFLEQEKQLTSGKVTLSKEDLCVDDLKIRLSEKDPLKKLALTTLHEKYHTWLELQRHELRRHHQEKYYETINYSPYFLFISNANPEKEELIKAFKKIRLNALEKQYEFYNYGFEKNITLRTEEFNEGIMTESEKEDFIVDLLFYLNPILFDSYLKIIEKREGDTKAIYQQVHDLKKSEMNWAIAKEMSIIMGSLLTCFAPIGRITKLARISKAFRPLCLISLGAPRQWLLSC